MAGNIGYHKKIFTPKRYSSDDLLDLGVDGSYGLNMAPEVLAFLDTPNTEIARIYSAATGADYRETLALLKTSTKYLRWSGADEFLAVDRDGEKRAVLIETNSCPGGARSMPSASITRVEDSAFARTLSSALLPHVVEEGPLAVMYDQNPSGNQRMAQVLATLSGREVYGVYVPTPEVAARHIDPHTLMVDGIPIAGAHRFVTQDPWRKLAILNQRDGVEIPVSNPVIACLGGARNKAVATAAYTAFNQTSRIKLSVPVTTAAVPRREAFDMVRRDFGGVAVVKDPYSNSGIGVWTITNKEELERAEAETDDGRFYLVQQLVGSEEVTSNGSIPQLHHSGCIVDGESFATDYRVIVVSHPTEGFRLAGLYSRRGRAPLNQLGRREVDSWDVLGTNLSVLERVLADGEKVWKTEADRRIIPTAEDYASMNITRDDLAKMYVTAVAATVAIDRVAQNLVRKDGSFDRELFLRLNGGEQRLLEEIIFPRGASLHAQQREAVAALG